MLVFNEGMPRAGKSYDAVKAHILPALKAGRMVYARLNGLDHEKIAAYLKMPVDQVRDLLQLVPTGDVRSTFRAVQDFESDDKVWKIPDALKNALFVVDEVHEFYVADRLPIDPAIENFFSLHGQNGMDGVLLSQYYRRIHSSIRCRIERKNVFQKLSAVAMKTSYLVTRYHTVSPEHFEVIGSDTLKYDPEIFPLYEGYAPGATNTDVYTAGAKTVWHKLAKYALVMVPAVFLGVYMLFHFFTGGAGMVKHKAVEPLHPSFTRKASDAPGQVLPGSGSSPSVSAVSFQPHADAADLKAMPDSVGYIWKLTEQARPRLAASVNYSGTNYGVIEWPQATGDMLERLTFSQLRAMGVLVEVTGYGVRLSWHKSELIVTAWPLPDPQQQTAVPDASQSPPVAQSSRVPEPPALRGQGAYPRATAKPYDASAFAPEQGTTTLGQYGAANGAR